MNAAAFRRLLITALLALLPLQMSWAVVGEYCGHEAGPAMHLGHHEHEHDAKADDHAGGTLPDGGSHPDCGVCQAGHAMFVNGLALHDVPAVSAGVDAHRSARLAAQPPSPPEKPNWFRLA